MLVAALIHRARLTKLTCVFVDLHGLLRLNEGQMVMDMYLRAGLARQGHPPSMRAKSPG